MAREVVKSTYFDYLRSDCWRCPDAPIDRDYKLQALYGVGAHYWKHMKGEDSTRFYCVHCFTVRDFKHKQRRGDFSVGR